MHASRRWIVGVAVACGLVGCCEQAQAQVATRSGDGVWQITPDAAIPVGIRRVDLTGQYALAQLNKPTLDALLAAVPNENDPPNVRQNVVLALPMPDQRFGRFRIEETAMLVPELAAAFPEFKTYRGWGLDDPTATVRVDWTSEGFHAMVIGADGTVYVDPYTRGNLDLYISHRMTAAAPQGAFIEHVERPANQPPLVNAAATPISYGATRRTFRLALAATAEYTLAVGGSLGNKTPAFAQMTTTIDRVNGIYERELAITLKMTTGPPASPTSLIFDNPNNEPYTNPTDRQTTRLENTGVLDGPAYGVGAQSYDIGHVFSTGPGGEAWLGSVCSAAIGGIGIKGQGVSGLSPPGDLTSDDFAVSYVAHEMGHQFHADHTFNSISGNCGNTDQRVASDAFEVGSGSTIMSYAGKCSPEDLQPTNSDYFHVHSLNEIAAFLKTLPPPSPTCGPTSMITGNIPPTVNAGSNYFIPSQTPFTLTASGSDADGDALTYAWEQYDLGEFSSDENEASTDAGNRPLVRSRVPSPSPSRTLPVLTYILNNNNVPPQTYACGADTCLTGEVLPTTDRPMTFQVTARDRRGGVATASTVITSTASAGPFKVTSPVGAVTWNGGTTQTVTWDVANTDLWPINASLVSIFISTDGGVTFSRGLGAFPNTGTADVLIPSDIETTSARLKVQAVGNIFFDISPTDFVVKAGYGFSWDQIPPFLTGQIMVTARGFNNAREFVGSYLDQNAGFERGFKWTNGQIVPIDVSSILSVEPYATYCSQPNTTCAIGNTFPYDLNDNGDIVGFVQVVGANESPFVLSAGQAITTGPLWLQLPSSWGGVGTAINNARNVVGYCESNGSFGDTCSTVNIAGPRGFLDHAGGLDYPGAIETWPNGINDAQTVVGYFVPPAPNSSSVHGFVWSSGQFTEFDAPDSLNTSLAAINNKGDIVGWRTFQGQFGIVGRIFVFVKATGAFLDIVGSGGQNAPFTFPLGINDADEIFATNGSNQYFVARPFAVPIITVEPTPQTVSAGQTAQLKVTATGEPPPTYQWQWLVTGTSFWADLTNTPPYSGVTTDTLTIANVPAGWNGRQYRVIVSNGLGTLPSSAVTLTVNSVPAITVPPQTQTTEGAGVVNFTVMTTGFPDPTYQWQASTDGGVNWVDLLNAPPYSGVTTSTLTITGVPLNFNGTKYRVVVTNNLGTTVSPDALLIVYTSNLLQNADFGSGMTGWQTFATPNMSYIVAGVSGGRMEFSRVPPPPGTSNQATVFQETGVSLPSGAPLLAEFDLGNTSSVRKYIKVLTINSDFSDFAACTFWLPPNAPMRTYAIQTHTSKVWTNAAIYFYASTANTNGDTGVYQIDNVSIEYSPSPTTDHTSCFDPLALMAPGGAAGPNLLTNGDFDTGLLTPWGTFGQITEQITGGVLQMVRPSATPPAGVVLQPTGQSMAAGQILTATFELGNSSLVRKRVTAIMHDLDFSDLVACVFWLEPSQPLATYTMVGSTSKPWTNATMSFYPATIGLDQWTLLDNVTYQRTPSTVVTGTECIEPGGSSPADGASVSPAATDVWAFDAAFLAAPSSTGPAWEIEARSSEINVLQTTTPIDLTAATGGRLTFESQLLTGASRGEVQVRADGGSWVTASVVPPSDDWQAVDVDLSEFAGTVIELRFLFDAVAPADAATPDLWRLDGVHVDVIAGDVTRIF